MSWASFCQTYERSGGALRLGQWSQTGGTYQATLTIGECIESSTVSACGPMAALTAMLSERGIRMETLSFHQLRDGDQTCTFIRGTNGLGTAWAMGRAPDATTSHSRRSPPAPTVWRADPCAQCKGRRMMGMPSMGSGMPA
ncbi:Uncharacterised protein [Mycobacteroides abscessus]|nr:Uncharacterised protein [Mycobacteroides abscessus]